MAATPLPFPAVHLLTPAGPVLAHAGGFSWDEALLVMAPLAVIGGLLWLANRRAGRLGADEPPAPGPDATTTTTGTPPDASGPTVQPDR